MTTDGAARIARERARQVEEEGYDAAHDAAHGTDVLARAAIAYLLSARGYRETARAWWPWEAGTFKPAAPARDLERAGALVAAAIDAHDEDGRRLA